MNRVWLFIKLTNNDCPGSEKVMEREKIEKQGAAKEEDNGQ